MPTRMGKKHKKTVSFIILLCYLPIINKRIRNEEKILAQGLEGYKEYMERVKYKVIPYIR